MLKKTTQLFIVLLGSLFVYQHSYAECDSTNTFCRPNYSNDSVYKITFIGHLNFDCYVDTLISSVSKRNSDTLRLPNTLFPKYIFWGRCSLPRDSMQYCPCYDTVGVPDTQKVWYTRIDYPEFISLRTSSLVFKYNSTDSVSDIVCMLWGKNSTDSNAIDTSTIVSLFGQSSLDTLVSVNLGVIDSIQTSPFFAMKLYPNIHLIDSARRDDTGKLSYRLPCINFNLGNSTQQQNSNAIISGLMPSTESKEFFIYPNPATNTLMIKYTGSVFQNLSIVMTSSTGFEILRIEMDCTSKSGCLESVDLKDILNGLYSIRILTHNQQLLHSQNIIVVH